MKVYARVCTIFLDWKLEYLSIESGLLCLFKTWNIWNSSLKFTVEINFWIRVWNFKCVFILIWNSFEIGGCGWRLMAGSSVPGGLSSNIHWSLGIWARNASRHRCWDGEGDVADRYEFCKTFTSSVISVWFSYPYPIERTRPSNRDLTMYRYL